MPEATGIPQGFSPERMMEENRKQREAYAKQKTIGERFLIPRTGSSLCGSKKEEVETILYRSHQSTGAKLPVLFNMHGGAWIGGDAILMESFCRMMEEKLPAVVVNVNYKKADIKPFPYAIEEVADAVCYFTEHAEEYGLDPERIVIGGHSAGAQLAAGAAIMLKERGIQLAGQMLVYPCTDMVSEGEGLMRLIGEMLFPKGDISTEIESQPLTPKHRWASPLRAADEVLQGVAPAIFIECGPDELKPQGIAYAKRLIDLAVPVKIREFPKAEHGFLEVNRPDYPDGDPRKNEEQAVYCQEAERYLVAELQALLYPFPARILRPLRSEMNGVRITLDKV